MIRAKKNISQKVYFGVPQQKARDGETNHIKTPSLGNKVVYNFTAIFEPAKEGGYVVYIPALPGCATQGETFEEAEFMIKDAVGGYLATLEDLDEEIPFESEKMIISKIRV